MQFDAPLLFTALKIPCSLLQSGQEADNNLSSRLVISIAINK